MRCFLLAALAVFPLAARDDGPTSEEEAAQSAETADRVREVNDAPPPMVEVVPETIGYADMEANDLLGLGCAYAPGTSMGARVIARETDAYMKIDGEMVRFSADPGSRELPAKTRTLYNSRGYALRLAVDQVVAEGESEDTTYEGTIWLYDSHDRVVYTGSGTANCGA